ncbi:hypothetical protein TRIP_C20056 [Candidatus Zixiibacteriota bacterium]|nr:hypothetical protein TRIP_C20056 [candidate division Zixibacteria bacterium]
MIGLINDVRTYLWENLHSITFKNISELIMKFKVQGGRINLVSRIKKDGKKELVNKKPLLSLQKAG